MVDGDDQLRGTKRGGYTDDIDKDIKPDSDLALHRRCHRRIVRAQKRLSLERRHADAVAVDQYLNPNTENRHRKSRGNIEFRYMPYLLPIMEDAAGRAVPGLPTPSVEDRNEQVFGFTDKIRALVSYVFAAPQCGAYDALLDGFWEDYRWGMAVLKTTWRNELRQRPRSRVTDDDHIAQEAAKAQEENQDILSARISDSDDHELHIQIHASLAEQMDPESPDSDYLAIHIRAHNAEMVAITREWPTVEVLRTQDYVYDTDVAWNRRTWEAELRSVRIKTLFALNYKNLNVQNLPWEDKPDEMHQSWEDMTVQVWEFHDITNNMLYVLPVNKQEDGLPLYKGPWEWGDIDVYIPIVTRPYKSRKNRTHGIATAVLCMPILERLADIDFAIDRHIAEHSNYKDFVPDGSKDQIKRDLNDPNTRFVEVSREFLAIGPKPYAPPPLPDPVLEQHEREVQKLRKITGSDPQDTGEDHASAITATESMHRSASADRRTKQNRKSLGVAAAHIARNFIALYKMFATQNISLRVVTELGPDYISLDPSDIPDNIDLYIDLAGESDDAKAMEYQVSREAMEFATQMGYPLNVTEGVEYVMRRANIRRPERFRMPETATPLVEGGGEGQTIPIGPYQTAQQNMPVDAGAV